MRIHISPLPGSLYSDVYIMSDFAQIMCYFTFTEKGEMIATQFEHKEGISNNDIKPAFRIDERNLREMLAEFAELAHSRGIENKSETFTKGKLEATQAHLSDMRRLVFEQTDHRLKN